MRELPAEMSSYFRKTKTIVKLEPTPDSIDRATCRLQLASYFRKTEATGKLLQDNKAQTYIFGDGFRARIQTPHDVRETHSCHRHTLGNSRPEGEE